MLSGIALILLGIALVCIIGGVLTALACTVGGLLWAVWQLAAPIVAVCLIILVIMKLKKTK